MVGGIPDSHCPHSLLRYEPSMRYQIEQSLRTVLQSGVQKGLFKIDPSDLASLPFEVSVQMNPKFGDFSTNAAIAST